MKSTLKAIFQTKGLFYSILGLSAFWFIATQVVLAIISDWVNGGVGWISAERFSLLVLAAALIGSFTARILSRGRVELGMVPFGGIGMLFCLFLLGFNSLSNHGFLFAVLSFAVIGGLFKMPLNFWIRERSPDDHLEHIIAIKNLIVLVFILMSVAIFSSMHDMMSSTVVFQFTFWLLLAVTLIILFRIPAMFIRFVFFFSANLFYRVRIENKHNIPRKTGALLVANHVSLLDSFLIVASVPRNIRFVMLKEVYDHPLFNWWFKRLNMIPVPGKRTKENLEEFNRICRKEIEDGHIVCVFPEGQLSRVGHLMGFKRGIEHIANGIDEPIIPVHIQGLVGTMFSFDISSGRLIIPKFKWRRSTIRINIGEPRFDKPTAFELRQTIMELQAFNFENKAKAYIVRKRIEGTSLKEICQMFALREVLAVKPGVKVLATFEDDTYLYRLAKLFQELKGDIVFTNRGDNLADHIAEWKPQVLLTDSEKLTQLILENKLEAIERVLVIDTSLNNELRERLAGQQIELFEGFVWSEMLISINTPDLKLKDIAGRDVIQEGSKKGTAGRIVPGIAIRIENNETSCKPNEPGQLIYKEVGTDKWVETGVTVSMCEDGFLTIH